VSAQRRRALEQLFDTFVLVAEVLFQPKYALTHHRKAEVPRLDDPGMHRTDGNLMYAIAFHHDERVVLRRCGKSFKPGVLAPQRKIVLRPGAMAQPRALVGRPLRNQADQVTTGALHPSRRRKNPGNFRIGGPCLGDRHGYGQTQPNQSFGQGIRGIHGKAAVEASPVGTPQGNQAAADRINRRRCSLPLLARQRGALHRQWRGQGVEFAIEC
jgi:hypothetical protein